MAAVVTPDNKLTYFSFPIEKKENTETINPVDGTPDIIIWGKATDGTVDSDRQIVDPVWSAGAIQKWLETGGNIRQSHDAKKPVGKGLHVEVTPDGHYVKSLIADPLAKHFIRTGVLNDYSVGISNPDIKYGHNKALDPEFKAVNGIITGRNDGLSTIAEISVVDRGSNYGTKFQLATKSAGSDGAEFVGKMYADRAMVTKSAPADLIAASNVDYGLDDDEPITVSVPKSASISFSPASLARLLEHKRIAEEREAAKAAQSQTTKAAADPAPEPTAEPETDGSTPVEPAGAGAEKSAEPEIAKRDFDRNVGHGGVDRDALPASAFVFPDTRDFPVTTLGDVSDAVSSWGRYKGSESFDTFKKKLTALANRKGAAYVAELPQAWKDEMNDSTKAQEPETAEAEQVEKRFADDGSGDGGAGGQVNPADAPEGNTADDTAETPDDGGNDGLKQTDEPEAAKAEEPDTAKPEEPEAAKAKGGKKKPFPGAAEPFDGKDSDGDGSDSDTAKSTTAEPEVAKAGGKKCTNCGKNYHADSKMKRCESCGTKLPKANKHTTVVGAKVTEVAGVDLSQLPAPALKAITEALLTMPDATADKSAKVMCNGCGANIHAKHNYCPECGKKVPMDATAVKSHDFTCLGCRNDLDNDEKYCPSCGKQNPGYEGMNTKTADVEVEKSAQSTDAGHDTKEDARDHRESPTPATGVDEAPAEQPVPEHREPDGPFIEAFEADNGIPTMPDSKVRATKTADPLGLLKAAGEPLDLLAVHDLTCPAYHPDTASKAHPYHGLESLDDQYWETKAMAHAAEGTLADGRRYHQLWEHSLALKNTDPTLVYQIGAEQHEAFKTANSGVLTGPGSFPRPGDITAGSYNRPYLASGHAAASPGHDDPNSAKIPGGQINAEDFARGLITAGHAAGSPGNLPGAQAPVPPPTVNGVPNRVFYTNSQRDAARQAMAAMHDHIAQTFPDLCPLHGPGYAGEKPIGARPVPTPEGVPTPPMAPATKADTTTAAPAAPEAQASDTPVDTTKATAPAAEAAVTGQPTKKQLRKAMERVWAGEITIDQARTSLGLSPFGIPETTDKAAEPATVKTTAEPEYFTATNESVDLAPDPAVIKAAVAEATNPLLELLEAQSKTLKKHAKLLDVLAGQPDPNGPVRKRRSDTQVAPVPQIAAAPSEPLTVNKRAALAQETDLAEWLEMFRNDPDPARREVAWQEMNRLYQSINTPRSA